MKLSLSPPDDPLAIRERNQLGFSSQGHSPQQVAEALTAALAEIGITANCFHNQHGFGDKHDQWDVTVKGTVFDEVLTLEHARLAKMSQRTRNDFAKRPAQFGVFVRSTRVDGASPWGPCEVTIYYTLKGRALTLFRKRIGQAIELSPR